MFFIDSFQVIQKYFNTFLKEIHEASRNPTSATFRSLLLFVSLRVTGLLVKSLNTIEFLT
jgi:hypothetical protein